MLRDMVDGYIEHLEKEFPVGKAVLGIVTKVNTEKGRVTLSLKKSSRSKQGHLNLKSLEVNQKVIGIVNNCTKFGVFCSIKGTNLSGLLHGRP
eukprot:UN06173